MYMRIEIFVRSLALSTALLFVSPLSVAFGADAEWFDDHVRLVDIIPNESAIILTKDLELVSGDAQRNFAIFSVDCHYTVKEFKQSESAYAVLPPETVMAFRKITLDKRDLVISFQAGPLAEIRCSPGAFNPLSDAKRTTVGDLRSSLYSGISVYGRISK
jgi:hypothetical protein